MYPFVMQRSIPVDFVAESKKLEDKYNGFVEAEVIIPDSIYIPPLPIKLEKLFFPNGKIRHVWNSNELIRAEKYGVKILKIRKAYWFKSEPIFKEYVQTLYELKRTATEPTRTIAKYLLNSLFGKFGQHPSKKAYYTELDAPEGSFPIFTPEGNPSGFAYFERESHANYLLPHIASFITSEARQVLYEQLSGYEHHVWYCDTDSIFMDTNMEIGDNLGDWAFVGNGECEFIQPKLYYFNGKWKAKGLSREQDIEGYVHRGEVNKVIRHRSIKEALNMNIPATSSVIIEKLLRISRPKRAWLDEQNTRPWNISELL